MSVLAQLREHMLHKGLDAYVIPATDPHQSEYVPDHWRVLRWASGFTGSAGTLVITRDFAGLWTDSRYFVQAEQQLAGSGIELMRMRVPHTPEFAQWLAQRLPAGAAVGVNGNLLSRAWYQQMEALVRPRNIRLDPHADLASELWADRPPLPEAPVWEHPLRFAATSRAEKLSRLRQAMREQGLTHTVLASLDDIAWLFNLRGNDVAYNPVFVAYALVGLDDATLFVALPKIQPFLRRRLQRDGVRTLPYDAWRDHLQQLPANSAVLVDPRRVSQNLCDALPPSAIVREGANLTTLLKAAKTAAELQHIRQTMIRDGVALTKFFYWLTHTVGRQRLTERMAQEKLQTLRLEQPHCRGESFGPISAYGPNAALPHYSATPESDTELRPEGIYLLDSGGQYLSGTTDTTRVIALGPCSEEVRQDYTLVLKGLIAVSTLRFPAGTRGYQMDTLARLPQWQRGINFGHGTGHGVGYFLCVHEGPQGISPGPVDVAFQPGMITSVEPGIYRPGKHGIRIENLVCCVEAERTEFGEFLAFETLTVAPIFTHLVDKKMLTAEERKWLLQYNRGVLRKIGRYLTAEEREWLKPLSLDIP
ncbi:MAG: aminopeptidase P family protein [Saprospiraceae bacterium]|nr:aminopeptidase P family protein [Saprospiraceae bacterium]MDW8230640.1 aminopeptidase P family protein [Saprospiraceae bacterium]